MGLSVGLKLRGLAVTLGTLAVACALSARAADGLQGTLAATSDYVHRGISQTDGRAALQGSLFYWHPTGVYGGVWASRVDTRSGWAYPGSTTVRSSTELDWTAGYGKRLGDDWVVDLKGVAYWYPQDTLPGYDYLELSFGAAWRERVYASIAYTPRTTWLARTYGAHNRAAVNAEVAVQAPLSAWLTGALGVGYRELDAPGTSTYVYGSARLTLQLQRVSLELGHFATDDNGRWLFGERAAGHRTVLTAMVSF